METLFKIRLLLKDRNEFLIVINALKCYQSHLNYTIVPQLDLHKNEFKAITSIVYHLIAKYENRFNDPYATKKPRIQEFYHHAVLMKEALSYYQVQTDNDLTRPLCAKLIEIIDLQLLEIEKPHKSVTTLIPAQHG